MRVDFERPKDMPETPPHHLRKHISEDVKFEDSTVRIKPIDDSKFAAFTGIGTTLDGSKIDEAMMHDIKEDHKARLDE